MDGWMDAWMHGWIDGWMEPSSSNAGVSVSHGVISLATCNAPQNSDFM
jgi:hypothetical protein